MARILVVDDEPKLGRLAAEMLELDGHEVTHVGGGRAALAALAAPASRPFDLVLTDLKMPEVDGLTVLTAARKLPAPPEVVVMTAFGTAESAVAAMKAGAADYLTKPFSMDELRLKARRLATVHSAEARSARLVEQLTPALVAESPRMKAVLTAARQVAATDATVLLLGESGTGKSQLARFIHFEGQRAAGLFVEIHCSALPETLLEGELFGHEKGAFTGAVERKTGILASADKGTLFMDEIGEVTPTTQVKLLRFLQSKEFIAVGSTQARRVDARVIAATNRDLVAAVKGGAFREDFFYRLNVFSIRVPPLRERPEDILPLAERFLSARGIPPGKLGPRARAWLQRHRWPGNVRELENALDRALILSGEQQLEEEHFSSGLSLGRDGGQSPGEVLVDGFNLDVFEQQLIFAALARAGGNKTAAAKILGITRRRLYSRLASFGEAAEPDTDPER
jgi:DNA-binding NtrC family response regulator